MDYAAIGKRIRMSREKKHYTQEQFAEHAGLCISYVGMIERGEKLPKLETMIRIANTLGVTVDFLLADVLDYGYDIKTSLLSEKLGALPAADKDMIYEMIDAVIRRSKRK